MRIFVTGGTGFMGGYFIKKALACGHEVVALRRKDAVSRVKLPKLPEWYESSLDQVCDKILSQCDAVVHFAAQGVSPQPTDWLTAFNVNLQQSLSLVIQAERLGVTRIIICGSCVEYGLSGNEYNQIPVDAKLKPVGPYAASKAAFTLAVESLARSSSCSFQLLRPFHMYGIGQEESNFWPSLKRAAVGGDDFLMTLGEQIRDYISVEEAADEFIDALNFHQTKGILRILNIGSGKATTLADFATHWWSVWHAKGQLKLGSVPYRKDEVMRFVPEI